MTGQTRVALLGLGRMGTAMAERLHGEVELRTWSRSGHGTVPGLPQAVREAEVVLLALYDGAACRSVLSAVLPDVPPDAVVVNTATVSPDEAHELDDLVSAAGRRYVHAPVLGSTPAVREGALAVLAGSTSNAAVVAVLSRLGEVLDLGGTRRAASAKLVAAGVLGDSVLTLRRALARAGQLGLNRESALEVIERTAIGGLVAGKHELLSDRAAREAQPATFAASALAKDLLLLDAAVPAASDASAMFSDLLAAALLGRDDDVAVAAAVGPDVAWLEDSRLTVSPGLLADPAPVVPLHAYARGHATGDPTHFRRAFRPTAHVEGMRDGEFVSWDLETYVSLFDGSPAPGEPTHSRVLERLDRFGDVATATMSLRHGPHTFTDVFLLAADATGEWRITNKVYRRY